MYNSKLIFSFLRGRHVKMFCLFQVKMFYRQARIHFRYFSYALYHSVTKRTLFH